MLIAVMGIMILYDNCHCIRLNAEDIKKIWCSPDKKFSPVRD